MASIMATSPVFEIWVTFPSQRQTRNMERDRPPEILNFRGGQKSPVSWSGLSGGNRVTVGSHLLWIRRLQQEEINGMKG